MRVYVLTCVYGFGTEVPPDCDVWVYADRSKAVEAMLAKVPSDVAEEIRLVRSDGLGHDDEMILDTCFDDHDARWTLHEERVQE